MIIYYQIIPSFFLDFICWYSSLILPPWEQSFFSSWKFNFTADFCLCILWIIWVYTHWFTFHRVSKIVTCFGVHRAELAKKPMNESMPCEAEWARGWQGVRTEVGVTCRRTVMGWGGCCAVPKWEIKVNSHHHKILLSNQLLFGPRLLRCGFKFLPCCVSGLFEGVALVSQEGGDKGYLWEGLQQGAARGTCRLIVFVQLTQAAC